ncbi:F-box only protein 7 isoform X3 [Vespa crabro]|uniref:F-box only protein 7 isoform X3 n=1 Tax=Vespa crabro TaxID=7445 RepID=UPI001EFFE149|nr:F-box only protein 7 isoform X3 [Vespa crabro]
MSESSLVEDSTSTKLTSTLENYLKKLDETTIHHEYMIALFIVLLSESGFYVLPMSEASFSKNEKLIYTSPKQWKTMKDIYEIKLVLKYLPHVICKLVAISSGDRLIVNFFSTTGEKNVYSIAIQSLKYVNPFSNNFASRYMNLKEISHRFKDALVMRVRADILTEAGLINPSFQGLPTELKLKILGMLEASTLMQVSQCSRHFNVLCKEPLLWQALLRRDFAEKQVKSDREDESTKTVAASDNTEKERTSLQINGDTVLLAEEKRERDTHRKRLKNQSILHGNSVYFLFTSRNIEYQT